MKGGMKKVFGGIKIPRTDKKIVIGDENGHVSIDRVRWIG